MAKIMVIRKMRVIVMVYRYGKDDGDQEFRATTMPISERHQYTNKHQSQNFNNPITRIIKMKLVMAMMIKMSFSEHPGGSVHKQRSQNLKTTMSTIIQIKLNLKLKFK